MTSSLNNDGSVATIVVGTNTVTNGSIASYNIGKTYALYAIPDGAMPWDPVSVVSSDTFTLI